MTICWIYYTVGEFAQLHKVTICDIVDLQNCITKIFKEDSPVITKIDVYNDITDLLEYFK